MEINTIQTSLLLHLKDSEPAAITIFNGSNKLYALVEMDRKAIEDFYEVNKMQDKNPMPTYHRV